MQINAAQLLSDQITNNSPRIDQRNMEKSVKDFEAYFVGSVFEQAYQATDKSGFFDQGVGNDIYNTMLIQEMVKKGTEGPNGFGLAEAILKNMPKTSGE